MRWMTFLTTILAVTASNLRTLSSTDGVRVSSKFADLSVNKMSQPLEVEEIGNGVLGFDVTCSDGRVCRGNSFCCRFDNGSPDRWCCPFGTRCGTFSCV